LDILEEERILLLESLEEDLKILKKYQCTDYSILISIYENRNIPQNVFENISLFPPCLFFNKDKSYIYCISLIDFLVPYDYKKDIEITYKTIYQKMKNDDTNFSAANPEKYADRLYDFIKNKLLTEGINQ
jgi:hypothetical protein